MEISDQGTHRIECPIKNKQIDLPGLTIDVGRISFHQLLYNLAQSFVQPFGDSFGYSTLGSRIEDLDCVEAGECGEKS